MQKTTGLDGSGFLWSVNHFTTNLVDKIPVRSINGASVIHLKMWFVTLKDPKRAPGWSMNMFTTLVPAWEPEFLGMSEKKDLLAGASLGCLSFSWSIRGLCAGFLKQNKKVLGIKNSFLMQILSREALHLLYRQHFLCLPGFLRQLFGLYDPGSWCRSFWNLYYLSE